MQSLLLLFLVCVWDQKPRSSTQRHRWSFYQHVCGFNMVHTDIQQWQRAKAAQSFIWRAQTRLNLLCNILQSLTLSNTWFARDGQRQFVDQVSSTSAASLLGPLHMQKTEKPARRAISCLSSSMLASKIDILKWVSTYKTSTVLKENSEAVPRKVE